jgi:hypothetical protein
MPFCPKCRGEFQNWVKTCPDCGVELAKKLPPPDEPVSDIPPYRKLITIARFFQPEEAHIVAARLESEGIPAVVVDEFSVNLNWAFGGVRVRVLEPDAADAKRILSPNQKDIQVASTGERCPNCNSSNIQYQMFSLSPIYLMFLLSLLMSMISRFDLLAGRFISPTSNRKRKCLACGYRWKNGS